MGDKKLQLKGLQKFIKDNPQHASLANICTAYMVFRAKHRGSVTKGVDGKHVNNQLNDLWHAATAAEKAEAQLVADENRQKLHMHMQKAKMQKVLPDGWDELVGSKKRLYVHADTGVVTTTKPRLLAALKARIETNTL